MKTGIRYYLLFFKLVLSCSLFAQENHSSVITKQQTSNLTTLGKVWGFLKYYHPAVGKGRYNWDTVLLAKLPSFLAAKNAKDINRIVDHWLKELGPVDSCTNCNNDTSGRVIYNLDTVWISDCGFDADLVARLQYIRKNRYQGAHAYFFVGRSQQIQIINEKPYVGNYYLYPAADWRLLTLFRYWNIINYFSPYKYITSKKWDEVLDELVPVFYKAKDTLQYHFAITKMVAALEDGHTSLSWSKSMLNFFGEYLHVPFQTFIIDNKAVITKIYNDSLCRQQGIRLHDIIDSIDGEPVAKRVKRLMPYVYSFSNESAAITSLCGTYLFAGKDSNCTITRWTPGGTNRLLIKRYSIYPALDPGNDNVVWKMLPHNIGYVNMEDLSPAMVDSMMNAFAFTNGIIFDLRGYPQNTWMPIAMRLSSKKFLTSRFTYPDLSYPGTFKFRPDILFGRENENPYKGKVILLVNAYSKSHSEFSAMALQAATKTITIGITTAGADGDFVDWFYLPGAFRTRFSGLGVYYPDGTVAQKNGVKIDVVCNQTLQSALARKDALIEKAIQIIRDEK